MYDDFGLKAVTDDFGLKAVTDDLGLWAVNDDFGLRAWTMASGPGRRHREKDGTPRQGVGRMEGQELRGELEDPEPGDQGHAGGVWEILIAQWKAVQQGALKVRSNEGVNTCRAMRRTTTA
eukprot:13427955-Heterocapsa_arctica.AAC.1